MNPETLIYLELTLIVFEDQDFKDLKKGRQVNLIPRHAGTALQGPYYSAYA